MIDNIGYTDLSQFEDAPEDTSNQDSACSLSNNNTTPENQFEDKDFNEDDDFSDEEDFDSDFSENDDGVPESKGPNCQVQLPDFMSFFFFRYLEIYSNIS